MTTKGEKANLVFSIVSFTLLLAALILNYLRTELFGVVKGYAPHNFGFNVIYFIPLTFLSVLTAIISVTWLFGNWSKRRNRNIKWITLLLILPVIFSFFIGLINIFQLLRIQY